MIDTLNFQKKKKSTNAESEELSTEMIEKEQNRTSKGTSCKIKADGKAICNQKKVHPQVKAKMKDPSVSEEVPVMLWISWRIGLR